MKASEVAALLMKTPDAQVLAQVGGEWVEVCGVKATGCHRNGVFLQVLNPHLGGGVIVVDADISGDP